METIRKNLFTHTLGHLEYGKANDDVDLALHQCIEASKQTGKVSEVTLKLTCKPSESGFQVFITSDIKTKLPKLPKEPTIFFPTEDGDLKRNNPRQNTIPGMKIAEDDRPAHYRLAK